MALYEITQDCRIANNNYSKWDVVDSSETNWYFPWVMTPINEGQITKEVEVKEEKEEAKEEVKETPKASAKKRQSKKK